MKCGTALMNKAEQQGSHTPTISVSPVKPLAGLVSMEIRRRRLDEEKTLLLGENQASALASNRVKY